MCIHTKLFLSLSLFHKFDTHAHCKRGDTARSFLFYVQTHTTDAKYNNVTTDLSSCAFDTMCVRIIKSKTYGNSERLFAAKSKEGCVSMYVCSRACHCVKETERILSDACWPHICSISNGIYTNTPKTCRMFRLTFFHMREFDADFVIQTRWIISLNFFCQFAAIALRMAFDDESISLSFNCHDTKILILYSFASPNSQNHLQIVHCFKNNFESKWHFR